jgi:hypothetical protein
MSSQAPQTAVVTVTSAWTSKINWTQAIAALAMLLTWLTGGQIDLSASDQAAIILVIGLISQVVTWVLKTFFTSTVHASSLPSK